MSMQLHWQGQMKPCGTDKPTMTAKRQHTRSVLLERLLLAHGLVKLGLRLVKLGLNHRHALLCVVLLPACCVLTFSCHLSVSNAIMHRIAPVAIMHRIAPVAIMHRIAPVAIMHRIAPVASTSAARGWHKSTRRARVWRESSQVVMLCERKVDTQQRTCWRS